MSDVINCPKCQRRLELPGTHLRELVRCPACGAEFSAVSALPEVLPVTGITPTLPPKPMAPSATDGSSSDAGGDAFDFNSTAEGAHVAAKPSSKRGVVIAFAIVGVCVSGLITLLTLAGIYLAQQSQNAGSTAFRPPEDKAKRLDEVREAFGNQKPVIAEEVIAELKPVFEDLGAAFRAADGNRIITHFDIDRMVDEFVAVGLPVRNAKQRADFVTGMRLGVGNAMQLQAAIFQWTSSDFRNVKKLGDQEVVVIIRHQHPQEHSLKMRWWLTRRSGAWKIYDLEDLDSAIRLSTTMGVLATQRPGDMAQLSRVSNSLREAMMALAIQEDIDTAEKKLQEVGQAPLPRQLDALRAMATGLVHLHRGRYPESLQAFDKANNLQPDMPIIDWIKGLTYNRTGEWAKALKHIQTYRDLLGEDTLICKELGDCLRGVSRFPEAASAYRRSLDFNTKNAEAFVGLIGSLSADADRTDLGDRFAKLDSQHDTFDQCAEDLEEREFFELLEPLIAAMRKADPKYAGPDYYEALIKARRSKPDEAVTLFKKALARQEDPDKKQAYVTGFIKAMTHGGNPIAAYAALPDSRTAFRTLAAETLKSYRLDDLRALLGLHCKQQPDDPLLPLYQGELYVREGQYRLAENSFTIAIARKPDQETLKEFRASRVLVRYHTGQATQAYQEIGPKNETFLQLAQLMFQDQKDEELQKLLDLYRTQDPDNVDVVVFRYRLKIRQKQTREAVNLFKNAVSKEHDQDERRSMVYDFLSDMVEAGQAIEGYQAAPDPKQAFEIVARELRDKERFDELRRLVQVHRTMHRSHPWLGYYQGEIYLFDKQWDKAAEAFNEILKQAAEDDRPSFQWKWVFAMYKAGQMAQAYASAKPPQQTFKQLAEQLITDKKADELQALIKLRRPHAADDADLLYYEARARLLLRQPKEAAIAFQKACRKQTEDFKRQNYFHPFLREMAELGEWLEAYRVMPDKSVAFSTLAGSLLAAKKDKELTKLLDEHGKSGQPGTLHEFYRGELALLQGDVAQADNHFTSALGKASPEDSLWLLRSGLFRARVKAGKAGSTYQEPAYGAGAFSELTRVCIDNKDVKQLHELLNLHRQARPDDPALIAAEIDLQWIKADYAGVLKRLTEQRDELSKLACFRWRFDGTLIRCLVKLTRTPQAIQEAEAIAKRPAGTPMWLVYVHAANGDVKQTLATLERFRSHPYALSSCYHDPDLGAILRSDAFREVREKYPEPKEERGRDLDDD